MTGLTPLTNCRCREPDWRSSTRNTTKLAGIWLSAKMTLMAISASMPLARLPHNTNIHSFCTVTVTYSFSPSRIVCRCYICTITFVQIVTFKLNVLWFTYLAGSWTLIVIRSRSKSKFKVTGGKYSFTAMDAQCEVMQTFATVRAQHQNKELYIS